MEPVLLEHFVLIQVRRVIHTAPQGHILIIQAQRVVHPALLENILLQSLQHQILHVYPVLLEHFLIVWVQHQILHVYPVLLERIQRLWAQHQLGQWVTVFFSKHVDDALLEIFQRNLGQLGVGCVYLYMAILVRFGLLLPIEHYVENVLLGEQPSGMKYIMIILVGTGVATNGIAENIKLSPLVLNFIFNDS